MSGGCRCWVTSRGVIVALLAHLVGCGGASAQAERDPPTTGSYVLTPGVGLVSEFGSEIKAGTAQSGGEYTFTVTEKSSWGSPIHAHRTRDVLLLVLEGVLSLHLDGETYEMPAGSFARIERGSEHALGYYSEERTRVVHVFLPGGWENFWLETRELGESAERTGIEPGEYRDRLIEIAERYDTDYIAPNPFGRVSGGTPN